MPYQPTVTDRTGEFLMRGITGAADSLAEGIRTWRKNKEESSGAVTALEGYGRRYGTDPDFTSRYGDKLAKAPGMSLSQQKALLGDLTLYDQQKRQQQEQALKERQISLSEAYLAIQKDIAARANERDAAGQRFTQSLASLMGAGGGPSMDFANTLAGEPQAARDVGLADIVQAAGQSGLALEPTSLAQLLRAEQMGQRGGMAVDATPIPFSAGGLSGVFSPKTGQFQVDKPEPNPKDARMTVVLERDEMDRPTRTWTGSPKQYEEQFGKALPSAPAAATAPDEDALVQEALAKATTDEQRATIRALYKQRTGRVLK